MFAVTGASGQLGRLVLDALIERIDARQIVALVRDPAKMVDYADRGVVVRRFDYADPASLVPALDGVDRLLLISGNELGQRVPQHRGVIEAAKAAGIGFLAYTSILHADTSPIGLAGEHRETEALIAASGLSHALLRNGWYNENYTAGAVPAVEHGAVLGSSGTGRISAAARADYAAAAAAILIAGSAGVFELAGDDAFTLSDFAGFLADASGKPVVYRDMLEADYRAALEQVGLPAPLAAMLADSSAQASTDTLFDDGGVLGRLIGRPTLPMKVSVAAALG
ncbi:NAD(P)H-binding protein [Sphingomonas oryzagri]|uniref:NAD(P)H-binding protein n=1 Tax=Sphingomonas oryzagri TaxID=3042314 RepID=A0ABT6N0L3_9SPHN|nr:NAD(P)H-binding protein [Sphingomonas oryzagri]MDH7638810.1 NAD(P)H-binding protein [Sphingomonas oryzagri]